jgi:tryptophan synthase alpha chain
MTKRLTDALTTAQRAGALSVYVTSGHPGPGLDRAYVDAAIAGGAAWLELGIPFSDPGADGAIIEAASAQALQRGHHVGDALQLATEMREAHPTIPLIAMTYANIAVQCGWTAFAQALAAAGFDGLILPDVPLEESRPIRDALATAGIAWVPLVTPMTPTDRMAAIAANATGFLYVVGNVGITGQADPGKLVEATVARARSVSNVPIAVGFGIAMPDDVARVIAAGADAAIVGSKIVGMIHAGKPPADVQATVGLLAAAARKA